MQDVFVIGISHHTAPLELRERLAVAPAALPQELKRLARSASLDEAVLISTCNRVELYAASEDPVAAANASSDLLASKLSRDAPPDVLYNHHGQNAVRHAFRVASSLDSLVVGEPQILGQVKEAYEAAHSSGLVGALLNRCFTRAFSVAKRVRTETTIGQGTVSVSSIACELAKKIFGELAGRRVLLIGAGEMGEASARFLKQTGAQLHVINRSEPKAAALAQSCGGRAVPYERLITELSDADVVIASTSSPHFLLTPDNMQQVVRLRRRRPLFIIDIAVPRDVDPRVSGLDNVFVYDIDDLQQVAEQNLATRSREAQQAERIIQQEVVAYEQWRRSLQLTPTIVALREHFHRVVRGELDRSLDRTSDMTEREIEHLCRSTVNKLLHHPITTLKKSTERPDGAQLIDAIQQLFELPEDLKQESEAPAPIIQPHTTEEKS